MTGRWSALRCRTISWMLLRSVVRGATSIRGGSKLSGLRISRF
jgi:hypothetical protein